jgi:hypothetical protein
VDLRNHITIGDIEARYATIEELLMAARDAGEGEVAHRLRIAAHYRELLEVRDQDIVGDLIGRLDAEPLDHVTIVLEMTTQQAVEEELRSGGLFFAGQPEADDASGDAGGTGE